ncbi:MAG: 3-phosphoserine/phosphohydroxythreonine aminotransferase [Rickettsiales bacterium]|nr:3-phosphoserine/phosphohydroxythreonine aminotransferase [Rickettsiales bacterium]
MPSRTHNFSAGPGALPLPVLEQAQAELVNFRDSGLSLLEASHRWPLYEEVHNQCITDLGQLLGLGAEHRILFMGGGARTQFALVPMNLLGKGKAAYITTGRWAEGAFSEACKVGDAVEIYNSGTSGHDHVPTDGQLELPRDLAYLHYTSNNTIYGTQFHATPKPQGAPLICDMSSDILSQPIDANQFDLIYAGAQKNMGPSGVTCVIVREDLLERCPDDLAETFNYTKVAAKNSLLNTPPVFPIYMVGLVARYLIDQGGLEAAARRNQQKAKLIYDTIDASGGFYRGHAQMGSRSLMNVTFTLADSELEAAFVTASEAAGMKGLKGHRSVGGLRASIYNAVPLAAVEALVELMNDFLKRKG